MKTIKLFRFYKHNKTGKIYLTLLKTNSKADPTRWVEFPYSIVYLRLNDLTLWSRPLNEWYFRYTKVW